MGLDQYAYVAARAGQQQEFYEAEYNDDHTAQGTVSRPRELAYWRKHPNLQGWMRRLWESKGRPGLGTLTDVSFNGIEVELTWQDLDQLEQDLNSGAVSDLETTGFFFGDPADDHYRAADLKFVQEARAELFLGLRVFYNSSW